MSLPNIPTDPNATTRSSSHFAVAAAVAGGVQTRNRTTPEIADIVAKAIPLGHADIDALTSSDAAIFGKQLGTWAGEVYNAYATRFVPAVAAELTGAQVAKLLS